MKRRTSASASPGSDKNCRFCRIHAVHSIGDIQLCTWHYIEALEHGAHIISRNAVASDLRIAWDYLMSIRRIED
jgi:hypothetical protein